MNWNFTQGVRRGACFIHAAFFMKILTLLLIGLLINFQAAGQTNENRISGKVIDEDGEGLPGVTIMVKGTGKGTVSDVNGVYSISAGEGQVLVFSFIGYLNEEVPVGNQSVIDVSLMPDIEELQEVVVVGYGTQRKEAVTGSVSSIDGDVMRDIPSGNVTQALQGRLPGVELTQTDSKPGAPMQIRIRGTRSLTASNDPLIVLDGIPFAGNINDIDPNSIKTLDILKDASATAIYGARGANGVILVTTNRGNKGQPAKLSYNSFYGIKDVFSKYPMMNGPQFATMRAEALRTKAELGRGTAFEASADEAEGVNTDWQDLLYRQGSIMSHDIGITKGTEGGNFAVGFGYFNDQAVIPTQGYTRYSLRAAMDQEIGKYFSVGLSSNNSYGISKGNQVSGAVATALGASPLSSPYDADGNLKRAVISSVQDDAYRVWTRDRIESLEDLWLSETKALGSYNNLYGEVEAPWVEGLKYRLNLGLNIRTSNGGGFTGRGVTSPTNPDELSSASVSNALTTSWVVENLLTYDRTFGGKHNVNFVGLYSAQEERYNSSRIVARDFPSDQFQFYNLGFGRGEVTINPDEQNYSVWGLQSWMGRVMYDFDGRYMLTATVRSDGSSRLAPGHKWHTYPAVSAGWNIARESFMEGISAIGMLKLRAGYGVTSQQAVDPYSTLGRLGTRFYNFGDNGEDSYYTGYILTELPNENLGWEFTETVNLGLDFGLFSGRLNGTLEYYQQHTNDILLQVNLPSTTGVDSYMANIGETENKGFELSLNGIIIDNPDGFSWEAGFNLYANRNKLVKLASGQERNEGNWWFVGEPINVIYDHVRTGIWQEGDPHLDILEPGGNVGMIKVEYTGEYDEEGIPVRKIGDDDRQVIQFDPQFQGGFNTRFSFKGLDLSVIGAYQRGGTLISTLYGASGYVNQLTGRHNNVNVDYWTPENTDARYPRPGGATSGDNPVHASTLGYFDASYMRIRNISLGYNFSQGNWMTKAGISNLRLYVTAQNPFVFFSPYHTESGMDPQANSLGNENQAVTNQVQERLPIVGTNTPSTRNYLVGINLTF